MLVVCSLWAALSDSAAVVGIVDVDVEVVVVCRLWVVRSVRYGVGVSGGRSQHRDLFVSYLAHVELSAEFELTCTILRIP